ncbi:MAG: hypothetical protein AAGE52_33055 [Myxococcota bacterium]
MRPWWVVLCALSCAPEEGTPCPPVPPAVEPAYWTDGMGLYREVVPIDAYFVPADIFRPGYDVPAADVVARSQRMTATERAAYAAGAGRHTGFVLFVLKHEGDIVARWEGRSPMRPIPRVWDGAIWQSSGRSDNAAVASFEFLIPAAEESRRSVYMMIEGHLSDIETRAVRFGAYPGNEAILRRGLRRADAVVYVPPSFRRRRGPGADAPLDCLVGDLTVAELPQTASLSGDTFAFLVRDGTLARQRQVLFSYHHGTFRNRYGPLYWLGNPLRPDVTRWQLAREATPTDDNPITLRLLDPEPREWFVLELVVGTDAPRALFQRAMRASQRDGGHPLFHVEVHRGEERVTIAPKGRFGEDSWGATEAEQNEALNFAYYFVYVGAGLVKLAIRPTERPWEASVRATYRHEWDVQDERTYAAGPVKLSRGGIR